MIHLKAKRLAEMQNNEDARVEGEVKKKEAGDQPFGQQFGEFWISKVYWSQDKPQFEH